MKRKPTETELQMLQGTLAQLEKDYQDIQSRDLELHRYVREKTNQLLKVMGTLPLKPEELDDETLISVDPIGIVTESFILVMEHLRETNDNLSLAKDEIQAIFDSAGAGILVVDNQKRLQAYNRKSQELFFSSTPPPQGGCCNDLLCKQESPEFCVFEQILASGTVAENPDFAVGNRHFHVIGTPIKNKLEVITHVILVYTDITERKKNEQALREAEGRLDTILNSAQAGILLIDPKTHEIVYANQATVEMTGFNRAELLGKNCYKIICPAVEDHCPITDGQQKIHKSECQLITADNREVPILKTVTEVTINGKLQILESFIDISERKVAEEKLRRSETRYRTLYSTMQEGVAQHSLLYNEEGKACDYNMLDINPAYEKILGLKRSQVIGRKASEIYLPVEGKPPCLDVFAEVVASGKSTSFEYNYEELGMIFSISVAPIGADLFATVFEDITERKQNEERIERLAYFDNLTALPNRILMRDRLCQMVARAQRSSNQIGLFFLDLDHFKQVNDTLGHATGDQLLKVVADRLSGVLRGCDSICRLGGDEFVILVDDIKGRDDAAMIACKLLESLTKQIILRNKEIYTSTSIGIGLFPDDGNDPDTLLKNADTAMYRAKEDGRNTYRFYSSEMNSKALEQLLLANDLRKALERKEFYLVYQPQIDLKQGRLTGVEALLRWEHADLGNIPPTQFIPLAEETGLILSIGKWVLESACEQAFKIQQQCDGPLRVAVNLSGKQFQDPNLVASVKEALNKSGLSAGYLELEITESILMENVENAQRTLHELKAMGVKLAIDDFGTGYSSLSYLRNFPIDRLKIDKTFIQRIATHPDDAAITEAIIVMGHIIGTKIVAEGVEQKSELTFLQEKNCDEVQGFYFSRPLKPEVLIERILHPASFCFFDS